MSDLDSQLKQRQKSSLLPLLIATLVTISVALIIIVYLFVVKGHAIKVMPLELQDSMVVEVQSGVGFVSDDVVYRFGGDVTIAVSAPTYFESQKLITDASASVVEVELKPKPGILNGSVAQAYGDSTLWVVNGRLLAKGAQIEEPLEAGSYQLSIENPYYEPVQQSLTVERDKAVMLAPELTAVDGKMTLDSNPQGADVYVDGVAKGKTPVSFSSLGGSFKVELHKAGFEPTVEQVDITNSNGDVKRQYNLKPQQAYIDITTSPAGGTLLIDGNQVEPGQISIDANAIHTVRYVKPGFYSFNSKVILPPKEIKTYPITLKPEQGKVSVKSNVEADVYINGNLAGKTPLTKTLPATEHEIKLVKQGYRSVVKKLIPSAKHTSSVDVTMLTEFDARRKEGRPLFISTLGIQMQLFNMTAFTMGSPANEIGRQRNEFAVRVDFTRPVWVGKHEVTQAQYHAFDNSVAKSQLPVSNISWIDAAKYCNWLSEQEALMPYYRINNDQLVGVNTQARGYRLLSEAEWEWLAKKAKRASPTKYVWGDSERLPREAGNFADQTLKSKQAFYFEDYKDGFTGKAPVGSFRADKAGLYDLAGNVSEWVFDVSSYVTPDLSVVHKDYTGPIQGGSRLAKGSNYQSGRMQSLRSALKIVSDGPSETIGFRIARYER
ncbi:PEGA domain-containing protein [Pseudoalteromonas pernae]|uniref:PEGA domain-containing protein n=1 Tax=Pseudoalteromonas pernae TaxID=3118054 RepID=UPI003242DB03